MNNNKFFDPKEPLTPENVWDFIQGHSVLKYVLYAGGAVIGIWVVSQAARLLGEAALNFKFYQESVKL